MKLDELLKQITPGKWRICGGATPYFSAIDSEQGYIVFGMADKDYHMEHGKLIKAPPYQTQRANLTYMVHAAEILPKLVKALEQTISDFDETLIDMNYHVSVYDERIRAAKLILEEALTPTH